MGKNKPITVSYEVNRLAESYLIAAYQELIPTIKQSVKKRDSFKKNTHDKPIVCESLDPDSVFGETLKDAIEVEYYNQR